MFTEYRKIHIVVIAKLGINIYIHTDSYVGNLGNMTLCSPFRANAHNSSYGRCDVLVSNGARLDGLITPGDAMRLCLWRTEDFERYVTTLLCVIIGPG